MALLGVAAFSRGADQAGPPPSEGFGSEVFLVLFFFGVERLARHEAHVQLRDEEGSGGGRWVFKVEDSRCLRLR